MYRTSLALTGILVGMLVASPALAGNWLKGCQTVGGPDNAGTATTSVGPGEMVCSFPTTAADDPPILATLGCENWDLFIYDDDEGDGTPDTTGVRPAGE